MSNLPPVVPPEHNSEPSLLGNFSSRRKKVMSISTVVAVLAGLWSLILPVGYMTESPGITVDTLGEFNGEPVLEIDQSSAGDDVEIAGVPEDSGQLDMTTVYVGGPPTSSTFVNEALYGLFSDSVLISPSVLAYPPSMTREEVTTQNTQAMSTSQDWATAAALNHLDIAYHQHLFVSGFTPDSPAEHVLEEGDEILSANNTDITGIEGLRQVVQDAGGEPIELRIRRDGEETTESVEVFEGELAGETAWQLGVLLDSQFEFPVDVNISVEGIGGPSAGMIFALAVIDSISGEDLTSTEHIAGTGTIDPDGTVGPIGGIVQKVHAAHDAGATTFLAPEDNCEELEDKVPRDITVYSVDTLDTAVEILSSSAESESFATCG